jgi:alpha-soluble NSF attachment protein
MFKMAKKWSSAGKAFYEAADLHAKAGSRHDAANNYVDAANCFKKSDTNGIAMTIEKAFNLIVVCYSMR